MKAMIHFSRTTKSTVHLAVEDTNTPRHSLFSELQRAHWLSLTPQSIHQDKDFGHARTCCLILWKPICHISGLLHAHSVILHLDKHTQTLPRLLAAPVKTLTVWSALKATLSPPKMPSVLPCSSVINGQMWLSRNARTLDLTAQG